MEYCIRIRRLWHIKWLFKKLQSKHTVEPHFVQDEKQYVCQFLQTYLLSRGKVLGCLSVKWRGHLGEEQGVREKGGRSLSSHSICFKEWDNECYLLFKIDFPYFSNNSIFNILTGMGVYFYLPRYPECLGATQHLASIDTQWKCVESVDEEQLFLCSRKFCYSLYFSDRIPHLLWLN